MHFTYSLAGKVAVVTGASRGIGRAIALAFADHGADLVLTSRSTGELEEVAAAARASGRRAVVQPADLYDLDQVRAVVDTAVREFDGLDILVNNGGGAGAYIEGGSEGLLNTPPGALEKLFRLNVFAHFAMTQAAAPVMQRRGGGSIINTTSIVGTVSPAPRLQAYGATKAALESLTKSWAVELGPAKIRVNCFQPGGIVTGNMARLIDTPEKRAEREKLIPIGRLGEPADAAALAVYLASDEASWVSGATIMLSGARFQV